MNDPVFSERLAREEDIRAEALALRDPETIELLNVETPSTNFTTFTELMMRDICRGLGLRAKAVQRAGRLAR